MSTINEKINEIAMKEYKGNNSSFAKVMGTSEANIRNYRKGTMPKLDFVVKLHDIFEISFDFLLSEKNNENPPGISEDSSEYKIISAENNLLKEKLKFQNEQIEFYKTQVAFLTARLPINKALNAKEIEDGLSIIDEIESISLKKSIKSVK